MPQLEFGAIPQRGQLTRGWPTRGTLGTPISPFEYSTGVWYRAETIAAGDRWAAKAEAIDPQWFAKRHKGQSSIK